MSSRARYLIAPLCMMAAERGCVGLAESEVLESGREEAT